MADIEVSKPQAFNLVCRRNDRFYLEVAAQDASGAPFDFASYTEAKMQARDSLGAAVQTFALGADASVGKIGLEVGWIVIEKDKVDASAGAYRYDLRVQLTDGREQTLMAGIFRVENDVTE
jgi:hypothetical protein